MRALSGLLAGMVPTYPLGEVNPTPPCCAGDTTPSSTATGSPPESPPPASTGTASPAATTPPSPTRSPTPTTTDRRREPCRPGRRLSEPESPRRHRRPAAGQATTHSVAGGDDANETVALSVKRSAAEAEVHDDRR